MQLCAKFHYWRRPRDGDRDIHVARAESLASGDAESSYIAGREREPRLGRVEFETTRKSDDEGGGRRTRTFRERPSGTPEPQKKIFHQIRAVRSISVVVDRASVCKIDDSHTVPRFDSITSTYITRHVLHLTRARHGIGSHRRVRTEGSRSRRPHRRVGWLVPSEWAPNRRRWIVEPQTSARASSPRRCARVRARNDD
jgi:hypothetical protein